MSLQAHPLDTTDGPGADVLVIGGGIIGLAIAWRAAQRGLRVTIADPSPGQGATHAAAGMLTPLAEAAYAERELFALGSESLRRYPGFAAELTELTGLPTGLRQTGTLQVAYDNDDLALLEEMRRLQDDFGWPSRRLTARECRAAEPMLDPSVRGGLLVEGDGSVDPRLLAVALLAAAELAGAKLIREPAAEIITIGPDGPGGAGAPGEAGGPPGEAGAPGEAGGPPGLGDGAGLGDGPGGAGGGRVAGARLADGSVVSAGQVVLAAGWQSAAIAGLPGDVTVPVRPVKGQILRLRPSPAALGPLLTQTVRGLVRGSSIYLVPREDGELVVGATQEELGPDTTVTAGGVWELLRDARLLLPGITEFELAEATAGLRPGTPDNAPAIGPAAPDGLVVATGHFRGGVLLAPVTADVVAEYLTTRRMPGLAAPFSPGRFWRGAASRGREGQAPAERN